MKSLILLCLSLLVADSFSKEIPNPNDAVVKSLKTPTKFDLDPDRLPINVAVIAGTPVTLECAVLGPSDNHNLVWIEYASNPLGAPISSNENIGAHPERDRYTIVHNDDFEYSLMIDPVQMSDGGVYQCEDQTASPSNKRVHSIALTVLAAEPNCTTTIHDGGVVFEDAYHTADCQLEYQGPIIPNMTWTGPGTISQRYIATPTHVWAGMQFNATRSMDGYFFTITVEFTDYFLPVPRDTADNVPTYRRTERTPALSIQWSPKNLLVLPSKPKYDIGDVLTCSADANPPATFFWQNLRTNQVFQGDTVTVLDEWQGTNQTLRCDARNVIEGLIFSNIVLQIVDVNPVTTPATTTTTTTTTPAPPVSDCTDLTGGWESLAPTAGALCIRLDLEQNGALRGLLRNDTDTIWVDIVGRAQAAKFDQVGFNGIWPAEMGVSSFIGECHRCFGDEVLLVHVVSRSKGSPCGTAGAIRYSNQYTFRRSTTVPCPNLPGVNPNRRS